MGKEKGKPKGKMSSYAYFVQTCREEHKKKHPGEGVQFAEFSKKCSEKWKTMSGKEKKRFEDFAAKDKIRYDNEMENWDGPVGGGAGGKRKKQKKDPNAPKRALSAFFMFCNEERPKVKAANPEYGVGDIAKELGLKWGKITDKSKFEALAAKDKVRYEKELAVYKKTGGGGASPAKKAKPAPKKKPVVEEDDDDDDEEDDDDDDEEESD